MEDLDKQLAQIHWAIEKLNAEVGQLIGSQKTTAMLIKFVILPLVLIMGGLVGIKLWG